VVDCFRAGRRRLNQTYTAGTGDVFKGFYVRIDNGASTKPYTRGGYVDNPHT
jgi:hypothetical protein